MPLKIFSRALIHWHGNVTYETPVPIANSGGPVYAGDWFLKAGTDLDWTLSDLNKDGSPIEYEPCEGSSASVR